MYSSPSLISPSLLRCQSGLIRGIAPCDGDNLVVLYYLHASEFLHGKRGGLWWEYLYQRDTWWEWLY